MSIEYEEYEAIRDMTGTCKFCGQIMMVKASSQMDADRMASENCNCDNILKKNKRLEDNIEQLCGEECKNFGMELVEESTIEAIKEIGRLCIYGTIDSAGFRVSDSVISVKKIKDGVSVSRRKAVSVKLEA